MKQRILVVLAGCAAAFLHTLWPLGTSALSQTAVTDPGHLQALEAWRQKSAAQEGNHLNRFALESLYAYHDLADSLANVERRDTLAKMAGTFAASIQSNQLLSDSLDVRLQRLTTEKDSLRNRYFGLLRKSALALAIWLAIISILLYLRNKKQKHYRLLAAESEASLMLYQSLYNQGGQLLNDCLRLEPAVGVLDAACASLETLRETIRQESRNGNVDADTARTWQSRIGEMSKKAELLQGILTAARIQREEEPEEKQATDINALCAACLALAQSGYVTPEWECNVNTDFEKRIPPIPCFPRALGTMLGSLLANAFQSMQKRQQQEEKSYKAALAVSTRVLPRFVQIRIKDNGTGIPEANLATVYEAFSSLNRPEEGAGLGLTAARRIMEELHQGELLIESEPGRGTDVYLKFYLHHDKK